MSDTLKPEDPTRQIETVVALLPPKVRAKAQERLSESNEKRVQLLNRMILKESAKRRVRSKATSLPGSLLLLGCLAAALRSNTSVGYIATLSLSFIILCMHYKLVRFPSRLEKAAQELLQMGQEPGTIGPLLADLQARSTVQRTQARESLIELLPEVTPAAFQNLTPTQRDSLYGTLSYAQRNTDVDLRLSVLDALRVAGDNSCLGVVYHLATGEATTETARTIREAARECIDCLSVRLDFGTLENLPRYINNVSTQLRAAEPDFHEYTTALLGLSQMLPQLTPSNYESVLDVNERAHLFSLLPLYAATRSGMYQYRRRNLHLEIVRAAERMGDTRSLYALQEFVGSTMAASDEEIYACLSQALDTLETLVEQKQKRTHRSQDASSPPAQTIEPLQGRQDRSR